MRRNFVADGLTEQHPQAGEEELPSALAALPTAAGVLAVLVGGLCIAGWLLDVERLRRPFAAFVAMNPATGLAFVILGIAVALSVETKMGSPASTAGKWLAGLVALIGAAKLVGIAVNLHPNIDELFFHGGLSTPGQLPNRMAPNTAVDFVFAGLAVLAIDLPIGGASLGQVFAIIAAFGAVFPLTGYLYGVRSFQGIASYIPMAPHTAITFLFICCGLFFCRTRFPLTQTFATRDPRGVLARRLAPLAVALIVALGWLRLVGEQRGFYDAPLGTALFAVLLSMLFVILIAWATSSVGRADNERNAANMALLESKVQLEESLRQTQLIIDHAREIICTIDERGKLLTVSSATEAILRRRPQELVGLAFSDLHYPDHRSRVEAALKQVQSGFQIASLTASCVRKDQTLAPIVWSLRSSAHRRRIFGVGREQ